MTVFSGQILKAGHFLQPTARAIGHSVMAVLPQAWTDIVSPPACADRAGTFPLLAALRRLEHLADGAQTGFQRALHPGVCERSVLAGKVDATFRGDEMPMQ